MHAAIRWLLQNDPERSWENELGVPINQEDLAGTLSPPNRAPSRSRRRPANARGAWLSLVECAHGFGGWASVARILRQHPRQQRLQPSWNSGI
jgi:hypothetical protein